MRGGCIPTERFAPIVADLIRERWPHARIGNNGEFDGLTVLADKVGCHRDTLDSLMRGSTDEIDFDLADDILVALGRWDMWHGVLADIYPTKFYETCAVPSCGKKFREKFNGPTRKRYCSPRCATLAHAIRDGRATGRRLRQRGYCLKGHRMTPENTVVRPRRGGVAERQCRECKRLTQREWARKRRADRSFRQKHIEAQRRWRAKSAA